MEHRPFVYLRWTDHSGYSDEPWKQIDDIVKDLQVFEVRSVGWVVFEDDQRIVICPHIAETDCALGAMCIIKQNIIERRTIDETK